MFLVNAFANKPSLRDFKWNKHVKLIFVATSSNSEEMKSDNPNMSISSRIAFCKRLRPQTCIPSQLFESRELLNDPEKRQPRSKSCEPRIEFRTCTNGDSRMTENSATDEVENKKVPSLNNKKFYKSSWLSPLEMCNVPADQKLQYLANAEKRRFTKIMAETSRLLKNESRNPMVDKLLEKRRKYKPDLRSEDVEANEVTDVCSRTHADKRTSFHFQLSNLLESSKDDALLLKLTGNILSSTTLKHQAKFTDSMHYRKSQMSENKAETAKTYDPTLPVACDTNRALVAGFYLLMKNREV